MNKTTIMISEDLKNELNSLKLYKNETYEEIISDLIDDRKSLSAQTLKDLELSHKQAKSGETINFEDIKSKLGLNVRN